MVDAVAIVVWLAATLYALVLGLGLIVAIMRRVWRRSSRHPAGNPAPIASLFVVLYQSAREIWR